ncbi:MAG: hypothetical protein H6621_00565 [Halobacteriovoraceae bacterium]|nr:hypothetical protein [Halobacteriovoraceae bacterium]
MAKRRKHQKIYTYECNLTGKVYKRTEEAKNPDELVSVEGYYQMNPDKDDRPIVIKKKLGIDTSDQE